MKVVLFGASGMVGQGVLRACVRDEQVESVLLVGRAPTPPSAAAGTPHPKVREIVHADFTDFTALEPELAGLDACFFCLGVSMAGRSEEEYRRITHDYTLAAARALGSASPGLTFVYVSGEGTDSSEQGRSAWARIKGRTENALLAMDFPAYMFRPGFIRPLHGARSRTTWYRVIYAATFWLAPLVVRLLPRHATTTDRIGRAMLAVARRGGQGPHILHTSDINHLALPATPHPG
ncbi:NAD-dependent epimerase/dehydratase family protein [Streptomyces sp. V4-01]|uniref:NAD-dependent epimerase/dehydratase family protein n=1 Tax=Actinacidiphila polyblastidii TaxID=3110430 RepID=A0ABU7P9E0_9ACTN|nr:NAD-dependent epimerase/dehydratase family protein [Streptomyces sp. V4-01]